MVLCNRQGFAPVGHGELEAALTTAREQRLELRAQENRQKLVALRLSSLARERPPLDSLSSDYGWIGAKLEDAKATRSTELTLSVPIFDGGRLQGRISEFHSKVLQGAIRLKDLSDHV
ncbi:MAG TPA: TolC family protein [Nitrospira sp.]|nr:TolC family protein [Nitrospira sp.]